MKEVKPVHLKVSYLGNDEYTEVLSDDIFVQGVKLLAMNACELELISEIKYAIQYLGTDQDENKKLGTYHSDRLAFVLVLIKEPNKG